MFLPFSGTRQWHRMANNPITMPTDRGANGLGLLESRVIIYAPTGKDGRLLSQVLAASHISNEVCQAAHEVISHLMDGASALIVADEALSPDFSTLLSQYLSSQPTWSDLPVLVLSTWKIGTPEWHQRYTSFGNVTLIERPLQSVTLVSAATSAIRARKRQFQMREVDRRKDEFLAMLAHELRNPLAPVSAAAELLRLPNFDTNRIPQTSSVILRQVQHMSTLIDDLLDISRVSRGLITLDLATCDARHTIASAVEQVQPLIDSRRHHLTIELAARPAMVNADEKRLIQITANLLNNAAKYTPEGGEIVLSLEVVNKEVQFIVADSGVGMTQLVMDSVFEMFTQGERTPDRSQGGLGIGLALVKSLVLLHGGSVSVQSDGIGRGSRFTVKLPLVELASLPISPVAKRAQRFETVSRHLLIVDDNVDAAESLAMFLEASGYRTSLCHDGKAAISFVKHTLPDACLLDIGLPDMSGTDLAAALRAVPGLSRTLLIAITGYGQESDIAAALGAGFDRHLVKPVEMDTLLTLLAGISNPSATPQASIAKANRSPG